MSSVSRESMVMRKTPNQRPIPPVPEGRNRENDWEEVLEHSGLGRFVVGRILRKFDRAFAEEVRPDVQAAAWEGLLKAVETYDEQSDNITFASWAVRIVTNEVYDALRYAIAQRGGTMNTRAKGYVYPPTHLWLDEELLDDEMIRTQAELERRLTEPDFADDLIAHLVDVEKVRRVRQVVDEMPNQNMKRLFIMHFFEGRNEIEVCEELAISPRTYYRLLKAGRAMLERERT